MRGVTMVLAAAVMAAALTLPLAAAEDEFVPEAMAEQVPADAIGGGIVCTSLAENAVRELCDRAAAGERLAIVQLGIVYQQGIGAEADLPRAIELLRLGARFGDIDAAALLGVLYDNGLGVAADAQQAARFYRYAARGGSAGASYGLGLLYHGGRGVTADLAAAHRYMAQAADAGHGPAQLVLGRMLAAGQGVAADAGEAQRRFDQALTTLNELAEEGDGDAHYLIGTMYLAGEGVPRDPRQAAEEFQAAVTHGSREAAMALGEMHIEGRGVDQSVHEAIRYWEVALDPPEATGEELNRAAWRLAERRLELDRALRWARRAVALEPQDGSIRDTLAWVLFHQGAHAEALREQLVAVRLAPECWDCANHLGDMYAATGRRDDARTEWRRALALLDTTPDDQLDSPRAALREAVERKLAQ